MDFSKLLGLRPGVTAVIGSGGKTSLLRRLAEELPGTVLLCTTTHIRPFEEYPLLTAPTPEDIRKALTAYRVLCLGTPCENGKLTAPSLSVETLATLSDYVLVEADGSRQLPLKAHEAHEPDPRRQPSGDLRGGGIRFREAHPGERPPARAVLRPDRRRYVRPRHAGTGRKGHFGGTAVRRRVPESDRHGGPTVSGGPLCRGAGRLRSPDRRRESSGRERLALPGYLKNMTGPLSPHSAAKPHFLRKSANISTESLIFANVFSCELHKNTVRGFTVNWFHGII
jgi:hypothetical protein